MAASVALFLGAASHAGNQLLITAANSRGNSVYDLTVAANSAVIDGVAPINTDGAKHGSFDSIVWVPNAATGTLDLLVADSQNHQILRYSGPGYGAAAVVYTWPGLGHGPAQPAALSVDSSGNLFVVSASCAFDPTLSLWVLPVNAKGGYGAPILIDRTFGGLRSLSVAETLVAATSTNLWSSGDLVVLFGDAFDARVVVYSHAAIAGVIAHPSEPLNGPTSTAVTFSSFLNQAALPVAMDQWPADATHGESLLFPTADGRILRFDTAKSAFTANFAIGLGSGLQRIRTGIYADAAYAFVTQTLPGNGGQILQFGAPPTTGVNAPLAKLSQGVSDPVGLAIAESDSVPASSCVAPNTCKVLGGALSFEISGPGAAEVGGDVLAQSCIVPSDPRVSFVGSVWTCNGAETLDVANYCPGFPHTVLPGSLCGHAGPTGSGFAVVKSTADGVDPFDNDSFVATQANISVLLPGTADLNCAPLGAFAWAPRSDLPGIEGTIVEDAVTPFFLELTGYCDAPGSIDRGNSMYAFGVAVNSASSALPAGLPGYTDAKYANLQATISEANIASATKSTLASCVSASQNDFTSGVNGAQNGFSCAAYQATQCDAYLRANLASFSSSLTATGGNPNPAGEIDGRLANLYLTINTRVAGNPVNSAWPANNIPACVTLTAPAAVTAGTAGSLSWTALGVPSGSHCALSGGAFNNTAEPASGSASTGVLSGVGTSYTYDLVCPGIGGASGMATATVTVTAPTVEPTVSLGAAPSAIDLGGAATLNWSSTNANSCTASGGWSGAKATSGSLVVAPNATTTYSLSCAATGNPTPAQSSVTVTVNAAPTVSLSAVPPAINQGSQSTLNWTSTGATSCAASGGWSGTQAASGSLQVSPATTTIYNLSCTGAGGATTAPASATVTVTPLANVGSFTANPTTVTAGDAATLTWSATGSSCSLSATDGTYATAQPVAVSTPGSSPPSASTGTGVLTQIGTYSATLSCLPAGTNSSATATLSVVAPLPLVYPEGMAFSPNGNLYVANTGTLGEGAVPGQVLVYAPGTTNSHGQVFQLPVQTLGAAAGVQNPAALAFDSNMNLYVADIGAGAVLVFNSAGTPIPGATISLAGGFANPVGVAVDAGGVVYVAFASDQAFIEVFTYPNGLNNGPVAGNSWSNDSTGYYGQVNALAYDAAANTVLASIAYNAGWEVVSYTPAALQSTANNAVLNPTLITNNVAVPDGIAVDAGGNVYVANAYYLGSATPAVTEISAGGAPINLMLGTSNPPLQFPAGVAVDTSGNIYVADGTFSSIDVFNNAGLFQYIAAPSVSLSATVNNVPVSSATVGSAVTYSWAASGVPAGGNCTLYDNNDYALLNLPLTGSQSLTIPSGDNPYLVSLYCSYGGVSNYTPSSMVSIAVLP